MFVAQRVDGAFGGKSTPAPVRAASPASCSSLPVSGLAETLAGALDGLLAVDPGGLSEVELAEVMVALRREQARLAAVAAEMTAVFDGRQVHAVDGSRSATDWIAVRCRIPRPKAAREVREARRLRTMPNTRAAFRAGDINPAHVRVLCGLAGHPRAAAHVPAGEPDLVDHARQLRFDDWHQVTDHWLAGADPDGPEQNRQRDHDLRRFRCPFHNRLWYHRPHLRPPQRRLDLHPPGHDPPDDDTPSDDPRADTPTGDLEHDPPDGLAAADAPPVVLTPARTNIVDRSRDHLSCRRSAPPRAPDLVATIDEAIYAIRLAA